jgi:hypothetical protein
VVGYRHRLDDLLRAKKTIIHKKETVYEGINAPGAEPPPPPPKPPTPPPPQIIVRDTGIREEYIQELERVNAQLTEEWRDLQGRATILRARREVSEPVPDEPGESMGELDAKVKEAKELLDSLKIENDLTKKTLMLMKM